MLRRENQSLLDADSRGDVPCHQVEARLDDMPVDAIAPLKRRRARTCCGPIDLEVAHPLSRHLLEVADEYLLACIQLAEIHGVAIEESMTPGATVYELRGDVERAHRI